MEIKCVVCLELTTDLVNSIDIHSLKWRGKNIESLIEKHLWSMDTPKTQSAWLCSTCWKALNDFHQFYRRIKDIHSYYEHLVRFNQNIQIEECKVTDILQEDLSGPETVWDTVTGSDNNDNHNDVHENVTFVNKSKYENQTSTHVSHHRKPKYISSGGVFEGTTEYITHQRESEETMSNSNSKMFKCKYCCKSLKEKRLHLKHIAWHEGNVYICEMCDLKFFDKFKLEQHKLTHTTRGKSQNHDDKTDNIPAFKMNQSIFSLSTKGVVNMESENELDQKELNTNSKKRTFKCKYCSKVLEDRRLHYYHIAWHEGAVYCCKICDLQYVDLLKFKTHKSAHKGVRTTEFSDEEISKLHTVSNESKIKEVDSDTIVNSTLKQSNIKLEFQGLECKYCPKVYMCQDAYLNHIAWHEENIFHCDLKFFDAAKFEDHKYIYTSKRSRSFDSNREIDDLIEELQDVHQEDLNYNESELEIEDSGNEMDKKTDMSREFQCDICNLKFFDALKFDDHKSTHTSKRSRSCDSNEDIDDLIQELEDVHQEDLNHNELELEIEEAGNEMYKKTNKSCEFQCDICDLKFFDAVKFDDHKSTHTSKRSRSCDSNGEINDFIEELQEDVHQEDLNHNELELKVEASDVTNKKSNICSTFQCDICDLKFFDAKFDGQECTHTSKRSHCCESNGEIGVLIIEVLQEDVHQKDLHHKESELGIEEADNETNKNPNISSKLNSNLKMDKFKCKICFKILDDESVLLKHIAWHEDGVYHCSDCELKFLDKSKFEDHQLAHTMSNETHDSDGDDRIQLEYILCTFCSKVLTNRRIFLNHNAWHVKNIQQCDICDLKFLDKTTFDKHVQTHITQPLIPCPDCGKTFGVDYEVRRHQDKMHRNVDVKVCDICGKSYRCQKSFKRHVSRHKGVDTVQKLPCDICGRILLGKLCLKSHQLIHHPKNGILPYCCDICLKRLATRALLNRHIAIFHSTLGDVKCHVCYKEFKSINVLKKHLVIHTAEPTYKCDWCEQKYYSSSNLSRHKKKSHPKQYKEWKSQLYVQI